MRPLKIAVFSYFLPEFGYRFIKPLRLIVLSLPPGANRTAVRLPVAFGRTRISIPARLPMCPKALIISHSASLNHQAKVLSPLLR
jgi:hypothetical protein